MTTVIVDQTLREKLQNMDHELVFCDEDGRTVGRYLPNTDYMKQLYEQAQLLFSDEELNEAKQQPGGYSTAEVLEHLGR